MRYTTRLFWLVVGLVLLFGHSKTWADSQCLTQPATPSLETSTPSPSATSSSNTGSQNIQIIDGQYMMPQDRGMGSYRAEMLELPTRQAIEFQSQKTVTKSQTVPSGETKQKKESAVPPRFPNPIQGMWNLLGFFQTARAEVPKPVLSTPSSAIYTEFETPSGVARVEQPNDPSPSWNLLGFFQTARATAPKPVLSTPSSAIYTEFETPSGVACTTKPQDTTVGLYTEFETPSGVARAATGSALSPGVNQTLSASVAGQNFFHVVLPPPQPPKEGTVDYVDYVSHETVGAAAGGATIGFREHGKDEVVRRWVVVFFPDGSCQVSYQDLKTEPDPAGGTQVIPQGPLVPYDGDPWDKYQDLRNRHLDYIQEEKDKGEINKTETERPDSDRLEDPFKHKRLKDAYDKSPEGQKKKAAEEAEKKKMEDRDKQADQLEANSKSRETNAQRSEQDADDLDKKAKDETDPDKKKELEKEAQERRTVAQEQHQKAQEDAQKAADLNNQNAKDKDAKADKLEKDNRHGDKTTDIQRDIDKEVKDLRDEAAKDREQAAKDQQRADDLKNAR